MNSIATHVEYLLRRHDCVVLPGMGAFICNYVPAHFDVSDPLTLNPPGRALAFNIELRESDGMLVSSVARKEGIGYDAAARLVADEVEMLRRQIEAAGEFAFGRLGIFSRGEEEQPVFEPCDLPSVNGFFYGLLPVAAVPTQERATFGTAPYAAAVADAVAETPAWRTGWRAYASGIAALLAVAVTLAMFIIHPIRVTAPPETASIAPVPAIEMPDGNLTTATPTAHEDAAAQETSAQETVAPMVTEPAAEADEKAVGAAQDTASGKIEVSEKPAELIRRFNDNDPYCVVVASFPTRALAEQYLSEHSRDRLGVLEKDDKFRVYSATAESYTAANGQKKLIGQSDAWICRR